MSLTMRRNNVPQVLHQQLSRQVRRMCTDGDSPGVNKIARVEISVSGHSRAVDLASDQVLALFLLLLAELLEADSLDLDEAAGFDGLEVTDLVHGALSGIVQVLCLAAPSEDDAVALVQPHSDRAVDVFLGLDD